MLGSDDAQPKTSVTHREARSHLFRLLMHLRLLLWLVTCAAVLDIQVLIIPVGVN